MKLCSLGISCEIYSLSHLFIKQRQPKKLGEVLLCWMQLWEFPLSFSSGVSCFSCRRPESPFPISFPHQCCRAECELAQTGFTKKLSTSLLGTTLKIARCCEWPLLFMAKNIHEQSLCWHKLPVCIMWGLASSLVTQRWHFSPFLMHCVTLRGVSTHLCFPSDHNLEVILQCSTSLKAGIWKPQSKNFSQISQTLSAEEMEVYTEQEVFQTRNSSLKCWWKRNA